MVDSWWSDWFMMIWLIHDDLVDSWWSDWFMTIWLIHNDLDDSWRLVGDRSLSMSRAHRHKMKCPEGLNETTGWVSTVQTSFLFSPVPCVLSSMITDLAGHESWNTHGENPSSLSTYQWLRRKGVLRTSHLENTERDCTVSCWTSF